MSDLVVFMDGHTKKIKESLEFVRDKFIYVGFLLWEVRQYEYYKDNYNSFVEYVDANYDFGKSSAYNFISLCERFSAPTDSNNPSMNINKKYMKYSMSQLTEMLSFDDKQIKWVKPNSTVKEIREVKKNIKKSSKLNNKFSNVVNADPVVSNEKFRTSGKVDSDFIEYLLELLDVHESIIVNHGNDKNILVSLNRIRDSIVKKFVEDSNA